MLKEFGETRALSSLLFPLPSHRRPWEKTPKGKRDWRKTFPPPPPFECKGGGAQAQRRGGVRTRAALYYAGKKKRKQPPISKRPPPPGGVPGRLPNIANRHGPQIYWIWIYWTRGKTVNFSMTSFGKKKIKLKQHEIGISRTKRAGPFFIWNRYKRKREDLFFFPFPLPLSAAAFEDSEEERDLTAILLMKRKTARNMPIC